jgi:uncharacterized protein YeaO (DUF488 family)
MISCGTGYDEATPSRAGCNGRLGMVPSPVKLRERDRRMTENNVRLQRAYDDPQPDDGHRVLVDRVWPRGRTKSELRLDAWARDLGPSTGLRKWFGHDPARWTEFQTRYRAELADPERSRALDALAAIARNGRVTIVYGARDREHNQAQVIAEEIGRRLTVAP